MNILILPNVVLVKFKDRDLNGMTSYINEKKIIITNNIGTDNTHLLRFTNIQKERKIEADIKRRTFIAKKVFTKLTNIRRSHEISSATKMRPLRSLVFSIFIYGSKCWSLKVPDKKEINAFELFCFGVESL